MSSFVRLTRFARELSAVALLGMLGTACGDKPSNAEVERLITQYPHFKTPKSARIPRRIVLGSAYGNSHPALDLTQQDWVSVDWVANALRTNRLLRIVDNARPMSFSDDSYEHYIDIALTPEAEQSGDFTEDDEDPEPGFANLPPSRTPGWKVAVARRKLEGGVQVLDKNTTTETVLAGNAVAYFDFKWVPTSTGALFDQGGDAITHLDQTSWSNARAFFKLDSRAPQRAKVYLNRVEQGRWIVKMMECGRCGWFDDHP